MTPPQHDPINREDLRQLRIEIREGREELRDDLKAHIDDRMERLDQHHRDDLARFDERLVKLEHAVFRRRDDPSNLSAAAIMASRAAESTSIKQLVIGIGTLVLVGWGLVQGVFKFGDLLQKLGLR